MNILALNGSIRGAQGNTARLLQHAQACLPAAARMHTLHLATCTDTMETVVAAVRQADALLLGSGVYWNGYGSPMQRFLEVMTGWETTAVLLGKPAAVLLTLDSVGGTEVASRLLGALNLMGCWVPPLATVMLSRVGLEAQDRDDVYGLDDVQVLIHNLCLAAQAPRPAWQCWPVKQAVQPTGLYAQPGALEVDRPPWLRA